MAAKIERPRPTTKLGLASDVRAGQYLTRDQHNSMKPKKARTLKSRAAGKRR